MLNEDDNTHLEGLSGQLNEVIGVDYLEQGVVCSKDSEIVALVTLLLIVLQNSEASQLVEWT